MEFSNLTCNIAGINLPHPIINSAGVARTIQDVKDLAASEVAAVMVGSYTMERRDGNSGDTYYSERRYALNALGMPNLGIKEVLKDLPTMAKIAKDAGKPFFVSIAGFSPEESALLVELAFDGRADFVEVNMGCPNVWSRCVQHCIGSFDLNTMLETAYKISQRVGDNARVSIKLSPYSNPAELARTIRDLSEIKIIKAFTSTNTFPNALILDKDGKPRITANGGFGGMSGPGLKPIGLGQVFQISRNAPPHIQVMGVGGVTCGQDVWDYLRCGATVVQVGTAYHNSGGKVFSQLLQEMIFGE